ncbi:hypothetical protein PG996_002956 [Apiospora saccharicola]|uniref:Uncharacterized protein n=1 Tax=Apiospora saccharicola TaxID=335842 RepID=A0ABR1WKU2_9PEZI
MVEMTPIGAMGAGPWLLAISWASTAAAAAFFFFFLRSYTRVTVNKSYGWDDNIYNACFALLLACSITLHTSTLHGLGQPQPLIWASDDPDRVASLRCGPLEAPACRGPTRRVGPAPIRLVIAMRASLALQEDPKPGRSQ